MAMSTAMLMPTPSSPPPPAPTRSACPSRVHRRRGGEVLLSFLPIAHAAAELAEAEVAMGDERTHAARLGQGQRITVVTGSLVPGIATAGDVAEKVEDRRLVAAPAALSGKSQSSPSDCESVLEPVGEDVRLAQTYQEQVLGSVSHTLIGTQRVLKQGNALASSPRKRVGVAQAPRNLHRMNGQVPLSRHRHPAFEQGDCVAEFSPGDLKAAQEPSTPRPGCRGDRPPQRGGGLLGRERSLP